MEKIAIDLTWIRHGKVGGTESSTINLIDGIEKICDNRIQFFLVVSKDNKYLFDEYFKRGYYQPIIAKTTSSNQIKRVLWQNTKLCIILRDYEISKCLEPIYSIPFTPLMKIKFFTIIHDLQALHYPEYFSKLRVNWMKASWWNSLRRSYRVIAISEYVKKDILEHYFINTNKIIRIYDAINIDVNDIADESKLDEYGLKKQEYYYTVSSLLPHKNLETIIRALAILKKEKSTDFYPLVISGVGGKHKDNLEKISKELYLDKDIILTEYIDNSVRNLMYKNCRIFLFPSIFEGFGMPPIEAMKFEAPIICTKETSIKEVTKGQLIYVDNPTDPSEWKNKIECTKKDFIKYAKCTDYEKEEIANEFLSMFLCS